ncbi:MAG: carbohydrate kinase family protein [Patescibacteria group bacterium]
MKIDVVTFGSATKDVFLRSDSQVIDLDQFTTGKGLCFPLGSKVSVKDLFFTTGGGGTNTAATFARQGLKTAYVGKIGKDLAGRDIISALEGFGIITDWVKSTMEKRTNFSVVLDVKEEDRTILVYRGASGTLKPQEIPTDLDADWFYSAPFPKSSIETFYKIVDVAKEKDINLAVNPSKSQLRDEKFTERINDYDVLIVNQEEAAILTDIPYNNEEEIFNKIDKLFRGIFVMTKGPEGLIASDDEKIYRVESTPEKEVADRTGAGDSFGSGFVSGLIKDLTIKEAIQLGVANATNCLTEKGAKYGILEKGDSYEKVEVKISDM